MLGRTEVPHDYHRHALSAPPSEPRGIGLVRVITALLICVTVLEPSLLILNSVT